MNLKWVFLILISDGNGQEFWSRVQTVGKKLQQIPSLITFAVSASQNFNLPELMLYIGNKQRIFVGKRYKEFVPIFSSILNNCLNNNENKIKLNNYLIEKRLKDEQPLEEDNDEEKQIIIKNKYLNNQKNNSIISSILLPDDCPTDLFFVIDSFNSFNSSFEKQLALAIQLIERLPSTDIDQGKIRLAALSFGREPRLEGRWLEHLGKLEIQRRLRSIYPTRVQSSFASAVNLTLNEIKNFRRKNARLLMFILWSGSNGRNNAEELSKAVRPFNSLNNSELFAVAATQGAQLSRLKSLVGDQWHVFIDARAKQFVEQVSKILLECVLPPSGRHENKEEAFDSHEPINSVERIEHLQLSAKLLEKEFINLECEDDPIDLIILLNVNSKQTSSEQFDVFKRVAKDTIKQAPSEQFINRINITIWSGNILKKEQPKTLDDALFVIDRIDWPNNNNEINGKTSLLSLSESLNIVLTEYNKNKEQENIEENEKRLVIVLLTDGYSSINENNLLNIKKLQKLLENKRITIFGLNFGNLKINEILQNILTINIFSSKPSFIRLFNIKENGQMAKFVDEFQKRIIRCRNKNNLRKDDSLFNKRIKKQKEEEGEEVKLINEQNQQQEHNLPSQLINLNKLNCKIDLIFVIDTSQSVEKEFKEQLNLILQFISLLPEKNFENNLFHIGAISFHKNALLHFTFGEILEKNLIIERISNIQHTGGSTSTVNGINLALEQIEKLKRFDAKQIIILLSDGNSQDPWSDIITTADRLQSSKINLIAITVSQNHFFRELEMLAGNKMNVYINNRIKHFFEDIENILSCNINSSLISNKINEKIIKNQNLTKLENFSSDFLSKRNINTTNTNINFSSSSSFNVLIPTTKTISLFPTLINNIETTSNNILINKTNKTTTTLLSALNDCNIQNIDILFIFDISTSIEKEFIAQKNFVINLIQFLPEQEFNERISIGLIKFNSKASLQFPFLVGRQRDDILQKIQNIEHFGGPTSLFEASKIAMEEISKNHRSNARLIIILITDGHSQDEWGNVKKSSQILRNLTNEIYAITFSENFALNELLEYIKNPKRIYSEGEGNERFLIEIGQSIIGCFENEDLLINNINTENNLIKPAKAHAGIVVQKTKILEINKEENNNNNNRFERDDEEKSIQINENNFTNCSYSKMDLIIILDASSSRESVFEHQRELALSLIEKLPININDTHVAIGINSFTNIPVLRQTLGLGRDKKMVRKAIEDINYKGGSTLTSKAIELAIQDLEKGKRLDALQVIILMNDGMSQDPWENVLSASKKLAESGAERFGVALGDEVDLRELEHYIGNKKRIYRDGTTQKFLQDIVGLINNNNCLENNFNEKNDNLSKIENNKNNEEIINKEFNDFQRDDSSNNCQKTKLDLIVVLDNTDSSSLGNDPKLNSNRYLLLDVLGSLPLNHHVRLAVISIGEQKQELSFSEPQDRESIFKRIEHINSIFIHPNYAKAVEKAINYYNGAGRNFESNGIILIVGDGKNDLDGLEERKRVGKLIKKIPSLSCHAVDSSKNVDEQTLISFTGSNDRIYPYDRNAEFAHFLLNKALECQTSELNNNNSSNFFSEESNEEQLEKINEDEEMEEEPFERKEENNTKEILIEENIKKENNRQKDISSIIPLKNEEKDNFVLNLKNKIILPKLKIKENNINLNNNNNNILINTTTIFSLFNTTINQNKQNIIFKNKLNQKERNNLLINTTDNKVILTTLSPPSTKKQQLNNKINKQTISSLKIIHPTLVTTFPLLTTKSTTKSTTTFKQGCLIDLILLIDSSGSVHQTFEQEKHLAANIIQKLRLGPQNARVALIKFAAADKVRTIQSFLDPQSQERLLNLLETIPFSDGITAIHSALRQAIVEYTIERGARPNIATPLAVVITDGFGQHNFSIESIQLRKLIPNIYAVAINNNETMAIAREELIRITGDIHRVFTDKSIGTFYDQLDEKLRGC